MRFGLGMYPGFPSLAPGDSARVLVGVALSATATPVCSLPPAIAALRAGTVAATCYLSVGLVSPNLL